jgi:hypothetical protein
LARFGINTLAQERPKMARKGRKNASEAPDLRVVMNATAHAILGLNHPQGFLGYSVDQAMKAQRAARWKALAKRLRRQLREAKAAQLQDWYGLKQ